MKKLIFTIILLIFSTLVFAKSTTRTETEKYYQTYNEAYNQYKVLRLNGYQYVSISYWRDGFMSQDKSYRVFGKKKEEVR